MAGNQNNESEHESHDIVIKAAFHFRVFHTHVYARKTLNPSTLYIF